MSEGPEIPVSSDRRLNNAVAITVVLLSVAMALTKIKDDNIVQAMQADMSTKVDVWNEYQATRVKRHVEALAPGDHRVAVAKYDAQSPRLKAQAVAAQADYDRLGYRDDQFDLSDGFSSIALAVTAIAALIDSWGLIWLGWGAGAFGLLFSVAGFAQLPIHPDWIIALLT